MTFSTPDLCDEFSDQIQILTPMMRSFGGHERFCGEIVTVRCFEDNSKVKELAESTGQNKVMVVDGGGSLRRALLGDMIAEKAVENGWQGFIINGCIRDAEIIRELPIGVQALNTHPQKTEKRNLGDINVAVNFGSVTFTPGHHVYADINGIVVAESRLV